MSPVVLPLRGKLLANAFTTMTKMVASTFTIWRTMSFICVSPFS
jgi:hypothetical protein